MTSDRTVAIFTEPAARSLFRDFRKKPGLQRQSLARLHDALTSLTPGAFVEKPFAGVRNLEQFRAGDVMRGYCVYGGEPPGYDVFYLFQVTEHAYDRIPVVRYDANAGTVVQELRTLASVDETKRYLSARHALDAEDVDQILERL